MLGREWRGGPSGQGFDIAACPLPHARQVINLELMDKPPAGRAGSNPWPQWPRVFRVDYGHAEAAARYGRDPRQYAVMSKRFVLDQGRVVGIEIVQVLGLLLQCLIALHAQLPAPVLTLPWGVALGAALPDCYA